MYIYIYICIEVSVSVDKRLPKHVVNLPMDQRINFHSSNMFKHPLFQDSDRQRHELKDYNIWINYKHSLT